MLSAIALCAVASDWNSLRSSYLTKEMSQIANTGVNGAKLQQLVAEASGGNVKDAMNALADAERIVLKMTGEELLKAARDCADTYGAEID